MKQLGLAANPKAKSKATWFAFAGLAIVAFMSYRSEILRWLEPAPEQVSAELAASVFADGCLEGLAEDWTETARKMEDYGLNTDVQRNVVSASRRRADRSISYVVQSMPQQCLVTVYTPDQSGVFNQIREYLKQNYTVDEWAELDLPGFTVEGSQNALLETPDKKLLITVLPATSQGFVALLATKG